MSSGQDWGWFGILSIAVVLFAPLIVAVVKRNTGWLVLVALLLTAASIVVAVASVSGGVFGAAIGFNIAGFLWLGAMIAGSTAFLVNNLRASLRAHTYRMLNNVAVPKPSPDD